VYSVIVAVQSSALRQTAAGNRRGKQLPPAEKVVKLSLHQVRNARWREVHVLTREECEVGHEAVGDNRVLSPPGHNRVDWAEAGPSCPETQQVAADA
jgi:hypothetical protein